MATIYVSPIGLGTATGASASNALPIASINQAIQLAGPGGTVILLSDQGTYDLGGTLKITHGGTVSEPVTVMGADSFGQAHSILVTGTRPAAYSSSNSAGNEIFKLAAGANNLIFDHIDFANVASAFRAAADISNITIRNMTANNVQRFFSDVAGGTTSSATVNGLTIENVGVHGFSKNAIELRYDTSSVVIRNVIGDSEHQDGDGYAMGVHLDGTVHDVLISGSTMENAVSSTTDYWNGDGFATESGVHDVRFEDCIARGNADAGFDLKSSTTVLVNSVSDHNAHNYRLWGDNISLVNPTGTDPEKYGGIGGQYQVQVLSGANVQVQGGVFADSGTGTTIVVMDGGQSIAFAGTAFIHADGAKISVGSGISGMENVASAVATGTYSTDSGSLIERLFASTEHAPDAISVTGGSIAADASPGTLVGVVTGHDPDGDPLTYALTNDANGTFTIDPLSGAILVAPGALFDVDQVTLLTIGVAATDRAGLSFTQAISVEVTPVAPMLAPQSLTGTDAPDTLTAVSEAGYSVNGLAGNDEITTFGGADTVCGGPGNDLIRTGAGDDFILFGTTASGFDSIDGGSGYDIIQAVTGGTAIGLHACTGVEEISANGLSNVSIQGSSNADVLDFSEVRLDHIAKIVAGAGDDFVAGSAANDVIFGGLGADRLSGGSGADTFAYRYLTDSSPGTQDLITDFASGLDRINLSALDASSQLKGNQSFTFIGSEAFTGHAGELRLDLSDPLVTHIYADVDGDKIPDLQIDLSGSIALQSSDFLL